MENGKRFGCRGCGEEVFFDVNRNGVRYLAERAGREYEDGVGHWKQPHRHTEEAVARWAEIVRRNAERLAQLVADGEIVKGQTVEVFKGRKVPKGTVGVVFWVAPEEDGYGVVKVGFTTAEGVKHFTNIANVRAKVSALSA
jgi:hypothetical protein